MKLLKVLKTKMDAVKEEMDYKSEVKGLEMLNIAIKFNIEPIANLQELLDMEKKHKKTMNLAKRYMKAVFPHIKNDPMFNEDVEKKDIEEQIKANDEKIETFEDVKKEGVKAKASEVTMESLNKIELLKKAIANGEDITGQGSIVLEGLEKITKKTIAKFNLNADVTIPDFKEEHVKIATDELKDLADSCDKHIEECNKMQEEIKETTTQLENVATASSRNKDKLVNSLNTATEQINKKTKYESSSSNKDVTPNDNTCVTASKKKSFLTALKNKIKNFSFVSLLKKSKPFGLRFCKSTFKLVCDIATTFLYTIFTPYVVIKNLIINIIDTLYNAKSLLDGLEKFFYVVAKFILAFISIPFIAVWKLLMFLFVFVNNIAGKNYIE